MILHILVYLSKYCQNQDVLANSNMIMIFYLICYEYNVHQNDTSISDFFFSKCAFSKKNVMHDNVGKESKRNYMNMLKL